MEVKEIEKIIRKELKKLKKTEGNITINTKDIKAIEVKEIETIEPKFDIGLTVYGINFEVKLKKDSCLIIWNI